MGFENRRKDGTNLHHDQARWRPEEPGLFLSTKISALFYSNFFLLCLVGQKAGKKVEHIS